MDQPFWIKIKNNQSKKRDIPFVLKLFWWNLVDFLFCLQTTKKNNNKNYKSEAIPKTNPEYKERIEKDSFEEIIF